MMVAEVMTTANIAAMLFRGNFDYARKRLLEEGYIPGMLSKSRFNRRLHRNIVPQEKLNFKNQPKPIQKGNASHQEFAIGWAKKPHLPSMIDKINNLD